MDPYNDQLPVGPIAQLVEHCTSIVEWVSRKRRPQTSKTLTSKTQNWKTQTSKRKRRAKLRDLNSLRSRAKAVFVFVPCLWLLFARSGFSRSAFLRSAFSRSVFSRSVFSRSAFSRSAFLRHPRRVQGFTESHSALNFSGLIILLLA